MSFHVDLRLNVYFVKCVCVTACGNFGLAGSSTGVINMWNMQSGILRKTFHIGHRPAEVAQRYKGSNTNTERAITGIATDSLNRLVIASTFDGTINVSTNSHLL